MEVLLGLTKGFNPQSEKLELNSRQFKAGETTQSAKKVSFEWSAHHSLRFLSSEFLILTLKN